MKSFSDCDIFLRISNWKEYVLSSFVFQSFSLTVFFVLCWVPKKMEGKLWSTSYYFRLKSTKITMIAFFRSLQQHYNCDVSACTCCSKINFCPKIIAVMFCLIFLSVSPGLLGNLLKKFFQPSKCSLLDRKSNYNAIITRSWLETALEY